ncbi:uncharacterized protein EV422DRAFT_603774 [Fimicolochytrium jonesii]|uniref:uncharacterized protein n=1 Tax=Fimicolochytrium jonesii TaxID=1396493 RepID=UPI0022FE1E60|nr:uncharacterized protein EV422DRAFT_603774 [Fimicolochytrium jonesii]KAI8817648.1 hypothetical protein EV422DRAFT_603774 [Fimicolochytrium jonesii]
MSENIHVSSDERNTRHGKQSRSQGDHQEQSGKQQQQQQRSDYEPIYENLDQHLYRVAHFCAAGQALLWLNVSDWCYRDLRVSKEKADGSKEHVPAPDWQRRTLGTFCLAVGVLFAGGVHFWSAKRVRRITPLKDGFVKIETSNLVGRQAVVVPCKDLRSIQSAAAVAKSTTGQITLQSNAHRMPFLVDRGGDFYSAELFDKLFHRA